MKTLRTCCVAVVLTFALMVPAFAGIISTGESPPPPPSTSSATGGIISTDMARQSNAGSDAATANNAVTESALHLLQSLLSLF